MSDVRQHGDLAAGRSGWWLRALPLLVLAIGLTALAFSRTAEVMNEYDRYPQMAETLLRFEVKQAFDRFHPLGYPLLIAAMMTVTRTGALVAGCLVSTLAAVLFVWAIGRLADHLRPGAGTIARWLAAANALVWTAGSTASSDLTAVALLTMAPALLATGPEVWTRRRLCAVGALLGAAVSMRYSAAPLAVVIAAFALWQSRRWPSAMALALGLLLGYLPHGILNTIATGSPFKNDNWHCTYLKVCCNNEIEQLQAVYDAHTLPSLGAFLAEYGGRVLAMGAEDLFEASRHGLPGLVLGVEVAPWWAQWWPFLVAITLLLALAQRRRMAWLLAGLAIVHATFVCFSYHAFPRLLLPALPVAILGPALGVHALVQRSRIGIAVFVALIALLIAFGQASLRRHLDGQPDAEVRVARQLPQKVGHPIAVLATYRLLDRYVDYPAWAMQTYQIGSGDAAWQALRERMARSGADVLLAGRLTSAEVYAHLTTPPPSDFRVVHRDEEVVAVELVQAHSPWIERFTATPRDLQKGSDCALELQLAATADESQVVSTGVGLHTPQGKQELLDLPRSAVRQYRRQFTPREAGTWIVQPIVLLRDGQVLRSASVEVKVAP